MAIANAVRTEIAQITEVTQGVTPATPTLKVVRAIGKNLNLTKNTLTSAEVRADRNISDLRHGFNRVEGSLGYEMSIGSHDDIYEAVLGGTWAAVTVSGTPDIGATASTNIFTRSAGSWITDGFRKGDVITTSGFTSPVNNGQHVVIALSAANLTVTTALVTQVASGTPVVAYIGRRLDVGTALRTFTIERRFPDISQFQVMKGVAYNTMELRVQPEAIIGGSFGIIGMAQDAFAGATIATATTAANTNAPFDSFTGQMFEGNGLIALVTGMTVNINSNRSVVPIVGSKYSPGVFDGQCMITGSLSAFFEDTTLYNKFVNETETALYVKLLAPGGTDYVSVAMPRVKYTGANIDPPAQGPIQIAMPFQALFDPTAGTSFSMQRSNAS